MGPIRGQTRPLPVAARVSPQKIGTKLNASIHNRFDVEVVDAGTGMVRQRAQAENVICSQLWSTYYTSSAWFAYVHYGNGSGTPSSSDTSLFGFLGCATPVASDDVLTVDISNAIVSLRRKVQLETTVAVGKTITEIGVAAGTSSGTVCTHALLVDMNGNQVSIVKTDTDIINIYTTIFLKFPSITTELETGIFKPLIKNHIAYDNLINVLLGRSSNACNWETYMLESGCVVAASTNYSEQNGLPTYNSAAKTITFSMKRASADSGNARTSGITAIIIGTNYGRSSAYDLVLSTLVGNWWAGSTIVGEPIGTGDGNTKDFSTNFAFVSGSPTVYIDGTAAAATVDINKPSYIQNMGAYFVCLCRTGDNCAVPAPISGKAYCGESVWYNPLFQQGIASFTSGANCKTEVSDDLKSWTVISESGNAGAVSVASDLQKKKYWRLTGSATEETTANCIYNLINATYSDTKNIHFSTAPASGAVITGNYTTNSIAKDANHVFDLTVTIQLGEYTG